MTTSHRTSRTHRTTLTARTPEDLLAVTPIVLGFTPTDSVVMLTFDAEHPFHARVDLPDDPVHLPEMSEVLLDPAARHRVRRVVLLVHTDDPRLGAAAWQALRAGCRQRGLEVVEALRVEARRWYPLRGGDAGLREVGVPYDVSAHPFRVQSIVEGHVTLGSRDELAATLRPDPPAVDRVRDAADRLDAWPDDEPPAAALLAEGRWAAALVRCHAQGPSPTDADVARLLRGMQQVVVRDAAWSVITRPEARAHVALWSDVVRRSPSALLAPAATLLGWSAWQAGDGALAWCAIDRCAAVDPGYSLMLLLSHALERALPPSSWDGEFDWERGLMTG